jgi:hypothetical protein
LPLLPEFNQGLGRGNAANSIAISNNNGQIVIKALQDGVNYVIQGELKEETLEATKFIITDAGKTTEVEKFDKVPAKYRPAVEELIKSVKAASLRGREVSRVVG